MRIRRTLVPLAALAIVAAIVAFLLDGHRTSRDEGRSAGAARTAGRSAPAALEEARLQGHPGPVADAPDVTAGGTTTERSPEGTRTPAAPDVVRVSGRVALPVGAEKLPEITVYVVPRDADNRSPAFQPVRVEADASGRFDLQVEDLAQAWLVIRPDSGAGYLPVFLDGARIDPTRPLEVELTEAPPRTFRVTDLDGRPLERAHVHILPYDAAGIVTWPGPGQPTMGLWSGPTVRGELTLRLPEAGRLQVRVTAEGYGLAFRVVDPDEREVLLRVGPSAVIAVRIENAVSGERIAVAAYYVPDVEGARTFMVEGGIATDGFVELSKKIGPGHYRLFVTRPNTQGAATEDVLVSEFGERVEVTISVDLEADLGEIEIELPDVPPDARWPAVLALVRRTDAGPAEWQIVYPIPREGRFPLRRLPEGIYDVLLLNRPRATGTVLRGVVVRPGARTREAPRLSPTFTTRMPEIDVDASRVERAGVVLDPLGAVPLYALQPGATFVMPPSEIPAAGTRLGPFPGRGGELRLVLDDRTERVVPLLPDER